MINTIYRNEKMKNSTKIALIVIILVIFAAAGMITYKYYPVTQKAAVDNTPATMKIGAILPLTGNLSFLGTPGKNAIALFKSRHPDSKVEISLYDSKADPKTAITEFRRAYDFDGARFFITTLTGVSLGVKPVAADKGAFQACIAIYPDLAAKAPLAFQTCYNAVAEARCIVKYIRAKGIKKIFVFASRDAVTEVELAKYILPALEKSGIAIASDQFDVGTKNFRQLIAKFKANGAATALLLGYGSDFQGILRELANQKLIDRVRIIGGIGYLELPNYIGYDLVKNSVFVSPKFLAEEKGNDLYIKFKAEYKKAFDSVPTYDAAYTYDTVSALARAAERVGRISPASVAKFLKKSRLPGVTGPIAFTDSGQLKVDVVMARYERDLKITIAKQ